MLCARAGFASTVQAPAALHADVLVWLVVAPCFTTTVTVPSPIVHEPANVGVVSFVADPVAGAVTVSAGGVRSTVNVREIRVDGLPAVSVARAVTV